VEFYLHNLLTSAIDGGFISWERAYIYGWVGPTDSPKSVDNIKMSKNAGNAKTDSRVGESLLWT